MIDIARMPTLKLGKQDSTLYGHLLALAVFVFASCLLFQQAIEQTITAWLALLIVGFGALFLLFLKLK